MGLIIRMAESEDAEDLLAIYAPIVEKTAVSFELITPTISEFEQRILNTLKTHPWLVCENDDEIMGYAYAGAHRSRGAYAWCVEPSVYTNPQYRRMGVARALYRSLHEILKIQGYYNAYAGTTLPNEASVALHQSIGFESVGTFRAVGYKFGKWHDVAWWQLRLRNERPKDVKPPTVPAELEGSEVWEKAIRKGIDQLRL